MKKVIISSLVAIFLFASCATTQMETTEKVVTGTALSQKQQSVISIAAFAARGDIDNLEIAINEGLDNGLTVNEIGEVLLQLYAYAGFPRALSATSVLTAVTEERQQAGISDIYGIEPDFIEEGTDKYQLGVQNLGALMGFPLQQQKGDTNGYSNAMDAFLKEHLFADIFARDNIGFDTRELTTISILASLEGTNSQQMFHMGAAMTVGFTEEQMWNFVEVIDVKLGSERGDNAATVLSQVIERRNSGSMPPSSGEAYEYIPQMFPVGPINDNAQIFTGVSHVAPLVPFNDPGGIPIVNVTFEPDSRTTWHAHSYEQILLVTVGNGYYQAKDEEPRKLKAGDTVVIPPGVEHWHGSAPGEWFSHIAIIIPVESDAEDLWLDPVDNEYYQGLE